MANMKEFTIKIGGVEKSYDSVTSLIDALGSLDKAMVGISSSSLSTINVINQSTTIINENTGVVSQNIEVMQDASAEVEQYSENITNLTENVTNLTERTEESTPALTTWQRAIIDLDTHFNELGESIDNTLGFTSSMISTFETGISVASLFGEDSNGLKEALEDMAKVQAVVNTLQTINNTILKEGGFLSKAFAAMESARATITKMTTSATAAATIATKAFTKALAATGVGAIVVLLGYLISNFDKVKSTILELFPSLGGLGEKFDKVKAIAAGVANVIGGQLVNGIKTFINVIKKVIDMDFDGVLSEIRKGVEGHLQQYGKFKDGYDQQIAQNESKKAQERAKKRKEELDDIIRDNEAKLGSDWKYTKEGQKVYKEYLQQKMQMYGKESEEFKAAQREMWSYEREITDKQKVVKQNAIQSKIEENKEISVLTRDQVRFEVDAYKNKKEEEEAIAKEFAKYREERLKKEREEIKERVADETKTLEKQAKKIKELADDAVSRKGRHDFIDADETKKNLAKVKEELTSYLKSLNATKTKIESEYDSLLATYTKDSKEYKKTQEEKEKALTDNESKIKQTNKQIKENTQQTAKVFTDSWKEVAAKMQSYADHIMTGVNESFKAMDDILQDQLDEAKEKLSTITAEYDKVVEKRKESDEKVKAIEEEAKTAKGGRLLVLQSQIQQEMDTNKKLAEHEKELAKEKEKQEKEMEKKATQQKRVEAVKNIVQATSNVALGVTKALGFGPILGPILAAVVGAAGAIQIGIMSKQLAKLEDGGLLRGKRHTQGGMRIEGTNIEVEGGEYVVNRVSTDKNIGLIRYINSQRRELTPVDVSAFFAKSSQGFEPPFSRAFEAGGQLPVIDNPSTVDNEYIVEAIRNIRIEPRVSVTDINRVQGEMVSVDGWVGL